jgi:acyl carrier protein
MTVTEDEILDLIAKEAIVDREKLTREAGLAEVGIASLDVISVIFEIEERFGIALDEHDIPVDAKVGDIVDLLLSRINTPTELATQNG